MKNWEQFEIEACIFLEETYGNEYCEFIGRGGADSTTPDIEFYKNGEFQFYIEAKSDQSQGGQFVLHPDITNKEFIFSNLNKTPKNKAADIIIEYMNYYFDDFNNAGTAGLELNMDELIYLKWLEHFYKSKNVKYFISYHNGFVIFPVNKIKNYFNVSAKYRAKRSGTGNPSQKSLSSIQKHIEKHYPSAQFYSQGHKFYVDFSTAPNSRYFNAGDYEYYLSGNQNPYQVRRRGSTLNSNVIFSLTTKSNQHQDDLDLFESEL